jgi:hypothetical protein
VPRIFQANKEIKQVGDARCADTFGAKGAATPFYPLQGFKRFTAEPQY